MAKNAGYDNFEAIVIENNSTDPATFAYYETLPSRFADCRVVYYKGAFNFSAINNFGATFAEGEHLLLLNNDIEVLSPDFLRELLSYSQRPMWARWAQSSTTRRHNPARGRAHGASTAARATATRVTPARPSGYVPPGHDAGLHGRDRCLPDDENRHSTVHLAVWTRKSLPSPTTMWIIA